MSGVDLTTTRQQLRRGAPCEAPSEAAPRRRDDLDHDVVAVAAMLAILVLTVVAFVAQSALPL